MTDCAILDPGRNPFGRHGSAYAAAVELATELEGTDWRDVLDTALDAMKDRRFEEANRYFDAVDVLYERQTILGIGWQFQVPERTRTTTTNTVRIPTEWMTAGGTAWPRPSHFAVHTFKPVRRVKQILAAMLYLAHHVANAKRGGRSYDRNSLANAFGVVAPTMREWIRDGLRDLGVPDPDHAIWANRAWSEFGRDGGYLEEDFEPAEDRQRRRFERMQAGLHRELRDPRDRDARSIMVTKVDQAAGTITVK